MSTMLVGECVNCKYACSKDFERTLNKVLKKRKKKKHQKQSKLCILFSRETLGDFMDATELVEQQKGLISHQYR